MDSKQHAVMLPHTHILYWFRIFYLFLNMDMHANATENYKVWGATIGVSYSLTSHGSWELNLGPITC